MKNAAFVLLALVAGACHDTDDSFGAGDGGAANEDQSIASDLGASSDAATGGDLGGTDLSTGVCSTPCFDGQTCVGGACAYASCIGAHVPGEYPTVQAAVDAMYEAGGTICLDAHIYAEDVSLQTFTSAPSDMGTGLVIQGVSASQTAIHSLEIVGIVQSLTLRGLTVQESTKLNYIGAFSAEQCELLSTLTSGVALDARKGASDKLTVDLRHCRIASAASYAVAFGSNASALVATLDGVEVTGAQGCLAVNGSPAIAGEKDVTDVTVTNGWIHDCGDFAVFGYLDENSRLVVVNTDFVNGDYGFQLSFSGGPHMVLENSILTGFQTALSFNDALTAELNNAFYGNASDFDQQAGSGTDAITTDCKLNNDSPPRLAADSPCRGAGIAVTDHDWFDTTRPDSPSLGAVE